jgi:TolB-like protein
VLATADIFEFEEFRLDRRGESLFRRDETGAFVPLPVGSRALDVLSVLVELPGELVTKEEIMATVWRRSVVENANLTVQISTLRRVLDEGRPEGSCIQTVAARGYRFLPAVTRVEHAASPQVIAPRLSIVVLPFANLSEGGGQQYFADGITDDLTTDLSRLQHVLVISRNTAFTYKDRRVDAKQIGRELGVLEGSVRRSGNQVRVNAQLIDAETNTHLWAERFDQDIGDLFAVQNEITGRIANTLGWELIGAETARPTDRPGALDYLLRGRAVFGTGNVRENIEKAVDLFERALALDSSSVETQSRLANALLNRSTQKGPAAAAVDLKRAEELIARALATSPGDLFTHFVKGKLLRFTRRCEEAIPEFEIFLAANRNDPGTLVNLSICKYQTGGSDMEAIALAEQANDYRLAVDRALSHIYRSGEIGPIFERTFGGKAKPTQILQSLYLISGLPD